MLTFLVLVLGGSALAYWAYPAGRQARPTEQGQYGAGPIAAGPIAPRPPVERENILSRFKIEASSKETLNLHCAFCREELGEAKTEECPKCHSRGHTECWKLNQGKCFSLFCFEVLLQPGGVVQS